MLLTPIDVNGFLTGILCHARAGNFEQALIQSAQLLEKIESSIQEGPDTNLRPAVPIVRQLVSDSKHSDCDSVIEHVRQAQDALGIRRGSTPAWSGVE